eukprot:TRINITY_DN1231_c0_g1_i6.p1 TRINITY_DN1231_c0_g1~~TRINITY_DN1231_c0_g1_i6.p1  ORF type:complete len:491 (-),score=120.25 TRINITY_DN1231_c0_g1_i6:271-1743(-)
MTNELHTSSSQRRYEYLKSLDDIQSVRDLSQDGIRDILRKFTSDHSLEIRSMGDLEDMSGLNDAFNSSICSMYVIAETGSSSAAAASTEDNEEVDREGKQEKEFNFVIKSPPRMSFVRQIHKLTRPFYNEVKWYSELVHQAELANGPGTFEHILPKCYYAHSTIDSEGTSFCESACPWFCYLPCKPSEDGVLILENIKLRPGRPYLMYDKRKPLPLDHVRLALRELAHFHGKWLKWKSMSKQFLLKPSEGAMSWKTFASTFDTQKRIPFILYKQLSNVAKKTTIKILKNKGGEEENIRKCNRFFNTTAMNWLRSYMSRPESPIDTLCHGDFWSNNILFSYDDEGVVKDLNIIDYQLLNYGHPCYDLVYFLYLNTDLEFRDNHLEGVLRLYHETFSSYVAETKESGFEYPFEDFLTDFNWHRSVGFTTACSVLPNVLSTAPLDLENNGFLAIKELQRKQEREMADGSNPSTLEVRRRIVGMVHEMARDGVI